MSKEHFLDQGAKKMSEKLVFRTPCIQVRFLFKWRDGVYISAYMVYLLTNKSGIRLVGLWNLFQPPEIRTSQPRYLDSESMAF